MLHSVQIKLIQEFVCTQPLHYGQDLTQGIFPSRVKLVWIQTFPSPRLVALPRLRNLILSHYSPFGCRRCLSNVLLGNYVVGHWFLRSYPYSSVIFFLFVESGKDEKEKKILLNWIFIFGVYDYFVVENIFWALWK